MSAFFCTNSFHLWSVCPINSKDFVLVVEHEHFLFRVFLPSIPLNENLCCRIDLAKRIQHHFTAHHNLSQLPTVTHNSNERFWIFTLSHSLPSRNQDHHHPRKYLRGWFFPVSTRPGALTFHSCESRLGFTLYSLFLCVLQAIFLTHQFTLAIPPTFFYHPLSSEPQGCLCWGAWRVTQHTWKAFTCN